MALREFLSHYGTSILWLPRIVGQYSGGCVVCGDAFCVWDDLERFGCRKGNGVERDGYDFFTVNHLVATFPGRVAHCYSNNGRVLNRFIAARRDEYAHEFGRPLASHSRDDEANFRWPWHGGGSSGLGAILTALGLGYAPIVLCGMPLDNGGHNGEPPWRRGTFTEEVPDGDGHWKRAIDLAFEGKVKSMSGRTRDWLGAP